jgi:glucokinase
VTPDLDVVLAIDFGGTKTAVGCVSMDGDILLRQQMPTTGGEEGVRAAVAAAAEMRRQIAARWAPRWRLVGAGAVSPGIVLPDRVLLAPNMLGWDSLSLPGMLGAGLPGLTVTTGNDVQAAALAELRWGKLHGIRNGIYVNIGTGLSAATVIDGRLVSGAHRAAGEIGYAACCSGCRPGRCSGASLEDVIGGSSVGRRASEAVGRPLSAADAFAASDPRIRQLVDDSIAEFGRHLAGFAALLDPERVVIGGGLMNSAQRVFGPLRAALKVVPFPPELTPGAFIGDAALLGAAAMAADAAGVTAGAAVMNDARPCYRAGAAE